jgi:HAD superfamily hydrolase (TIGR01484 family)
MDRTLLPNGDHPESPGALEYIHHIVTRDDIALAFVTGRDHSLVEEAIDEYRLPIPDYVIGDVGTNIYSVNGSQWQQWDDWHDEIRHSWKGLSHREVYDSLENVKGLELQEGDKQNLFKVSYYAPADVDEYHLLEAVRNRLSSLDIEYNLVWSVDETRSLGLLDILPASASKYHAIEYLLRKTGNSINNTLYAGDSGNDIDVLCSPVRAVLVANATDEVRQQAKLLAQSRGYTNALYIAQGGLHGMNGNYAAGIIEGINHYYPEILQPLENDDN